LTNVSLTSLHAHQEQVVSGRAQSQRERILECLKNSAVPLTRRQISELTRIPINAVCGRVNTLVASGIVRVAYEDEDQGTGTRAQFLEAVTPAPMQRSFAWKA
jgi:predicted ArsR family transcriptional regulator